MKKIILYALLFATVCFWSSCHKCTDSTNPECPNYNPCFNKQATTAQFTIMQYSDTTQLPSELRPYWKFYDSDSAFLGGTNVVFRATLDSATYEWHIGAGVYTTRSVSLGFNALTGPTVIPITLIVKKQPNRLCFPNGKNADTLTRNLSMVYGQPDKYFFGTYQGAFTDSPNVTLTFSIIRKPTPYPNQPDHYTPCIVNFFAAGDTSVIAAPPIHDLGLIRQTFVQVNSGRYTDFIIYAQDDRKAELTFSISNPSTSTSTVRIFKGQKL